MIENKIIKFSVAKEFDKGWTLFRPFVPNFNVDKSRVEISISDIISKITKAEKVNIILCEICLSSAILRELEWVNKYISINLIAKDNQIAEFYSSKLKFETVKVDSNVTFNYLAILSKEPLYIFIEDSYTEVDGTINNVYFENKDGISLDISDISEIYAIDFSIDSCTLDLLEKFNDATTYYVISESAFNKDIYSTFKNSGNNLLVGKFFRSGIVVVDKNKDLFLLHKLQNGVLFKKKISGISGFVKGLFKCELLDENIDYSIISNDYFIWDNGMLAPIALNPSVTINKSIKMEDMYSFIVEDFDRSIMDMHNDYSGENEKVEYIFELIPPILPHNAQYSKLYTELLDCFQEWNNLRNSIFNVCTEELLKITNESKLYSVCSNFLLWSDWLNNSVSNYNFGHFSTKILEFKAFLEESKKNLLLYVGEVYASLGTVSDSGRFDKIDNEIAGYEQTIVVKQTLVDQKIDVISNKRRIEILQKKINDLRSLKTHFENDSDKRTDKAIAAFMSKCQDYINGVQKRESNDSLGNIVKTKEESKETLLEVFASERLYILNEQLEKCLIVINKMCSIEIPDDYTVYDVDDKRMIVINEIDEFKRTKEIQERYNLNCVVRR